MDFKDTELFKVYLILFFKNVAGSIFHLFSAVYLFVNGFSFLEIGGFYIFMSLTMIGSVFLMGTGKLRLKTKPLINVGLMFLVLTMVMMYFLPSNPQILLVTSIMFGLQTCFFWVPVHATFAYESKGRIMGKEAGIYVVMQKTGNIIGPLLASAVIIFWGFEFIYMIAMIFALCAMVSVTSLKVSFKIPKINFRRAFPRFDKGVSIALTGEAINGRLLTVALPLFMFLIIGSVAPVGWLVSLAILFGFITIFFVGVLSDKKKKFEKKIFKIGIGASSLSWILRIFAFNFWTLLFLEYFDNIASSIRTVPFHAYYYNKARNSHHVLEYTMVREIIIHTAIVLFMLLMVLMLYMFPIQYVFILGSIGVLLEIFMIKKPQKLFFHKPLHRHK